MKKSTTNLLILFFILIVTGFLYKRYENKLKSEEDSDIYNAIHKYLLDDVTLGKSKKPILWIYVPYEYNSRNWASFGSRSSFDLNQPYLYLTARSIIQRCDESFTICIIDDSSFKKLIPNWNINTSAIAEPMLSNVRTLGMLKLLYIYGGLICPISFVCLKNLDTLYEKGTSGGKMFICESVARNVSSTELDFFPSLALCGAKKNCYMINDLCNFIQITNSYDYTANVKFIGEYDRWCKKNIENGKIRMINGVEIGTKTIDEKQVVIDDLMSNYYLNICQNAYGILIPADELLKRTKFNWFARLSPKQVLESETIIGNYILLSQTNETGILEPLEPKINKKIEKNFVGFWKVPSDAPLWSLKPNYLGNNLQKMPYPAR